MSVTASQSQRRRVFETANRMLADGRLVLDEVIEALGEPALGFLQQGSDGVVCPEPVYEQLCKLVERAAQRARHQIERPGRPAPLQPQALAPQDAATAAGLVTVRLLLIGFEPFAAVELFDLVECSPDTRVEIGRAREPALAPALLASGDFDVAMIDLSRDDGAPLDLLSHEGLAKTPIPLVVLARDADERALLARGWRDYLLRSQLRSELLVRTLRFACERHALERALAHSRERERFHATRDPMTELPNRQHFRDELQEAIARAGRDGSQVAVLFVDLDRFKQINDTFGHPVGDCLITTTARRLAGIVRKTDVVARVGGDEFVLLLQGSDLDFAPAVVAAKILDVVAEPFLVAGEQYAVSASVGIAVHPHDGIDPDSLIRSADAAMYQAKATGRNSYQFYSQSMNAVARRRVQLESRLRRADRAGAFELYFQPRVEADGWRIVGAEALLRWRDAELGVVAPQEFVPIAEDGGLIVEIGAWALRRACAEHRRWREAGHGELRFSINLSSHQLRADALRQEIVSALWDEDVAPSSLEVEITESALIENEQMASRVLEELMQMGVGVALDDFGTGFSSLSYLKRFPVDTIKIDQGFVRDVLVDPDDASITEAILSIAEKLRLHVVAEGVETPGQRDFLRARGCREMQGFLFSPPLPADAFLALLAGSPLGG